MESNIDIEDFIEHFGVKGMRWGVRNEDETNPSDSIVLRDIKTHEGPPLSKEQLDNIEANKKKHAAKFEASEAEPSKGWRPSKSELAAMAVGAVVAGAVIYKLKSGKTVVPFSKEDYLNVTRSAETPDWVLKYAGKPMTGSDYNGLVQNSVSRVWGGSHVTKESFGRPPISFPKDHQFFRFSGVAEQSFGVATYSTSNEADAARYFTTFSSKTHLVTFKSTDTVRVADIHTQLNAVQKLMVERGAKKVTPKRVLDEYSSYSGGSWNSPFAKRLLGELNKQGFHGIVDEMDAGVYGETPLVLFDPTRFTKKVATPLKQIKTKHFTDILTDIPNRR